MTTSLQHVAVEKRENFLARIANLITRSPFKKRWSDAVAVVRAESDEAPSYVTSRACFASTLRAADLQREAHECMARKVGRGEILVWIELDQNELACAGFVVLDLLSEARAVRGAP